MIGAGMPTLDDAKTAKPATKGEQTRQRIVAAAATMFNQKGYEGASLSALMEATGLEKGGIYRHFSSKEELAAEAFEYAWNKAWDARMHDLDQYPGAADKLKKFVSNFVERRSPVAGGCPIFNMAIDADDTNPLLRARAAKALRSLLGRIKGIVAAGIEAGEIRGDVDPKTVASLIFASLEGALVLSRLERSECALQQMGEHLSKYIDGQVASPAAAE
jgi:TetR/AcrR family transcriptional repressor of nem operon